MTKNQQKLLTQIRSRRNEARPVVCLHILGQDLINELCAIIIILSDKINDMTIHRDQND